MPTKKLTKRVVDEARASDKVDILWDAELKGFGLKVLPTGRKKFIFQYRRGGRGVTPQRVDIGAFGAPWTVDMARKEAGRLAHSLTQGSDPAAERRTGRAAAVELAFASFAEFFINEYLPAHWIGFQTEGARLLRREAVPHFRATPLTQIRKRDVTALFDKLRDRPGIAKNTSTVLRKLFNWAVSRGDIEVSPMTGIALPKGPGERRRYLKNEELVLVWRAASELDHPYGRVVQAIILTGQRRDEVAEMRASELDFAAGIWTIPAERMKRVKVEREHLVHLPPETMDLLGNARRGECNFVFSARGTQPVQNWSYWKKRIDARIAAIHGEPLKPWTLHDLRRSVASGMQRLGVDQEVIEAGQSRRPVKGNAGRYQRHDFLPERQEAFTRWAAHIGACVGAPRLLEAA